MGTVVVETSIARPPEEVFAYLRDYSNEAKWQSQHVSQSIVEPPGPAGVGTKVHKVRRTPGGEQRFTIEITEMDEGARRWVDVTRTGSFRGTKGSWQVTPEGNGSKVQLVAEMNAAGLWRLLLPLIDSSARKDLPAEFANLGSPVLGGTEPYTTVSLPRIHADFREKFKKFVSIREIRGEDVWLSR